jgi:hypothetical protein
LGALYSTGVEVTVICLGINRILLFDSEHMYRISFFSLIHSVHVKAATIQGVIGFAIYRPHLHETLKAMQQIEMCLCENKLNVH